MANDDTIRAAKPDSIDEQKVQSSENTQEESELLLQRIQEKYQRKQERLDEMKEQEKKVRAAAVMTKRRYREVTAALKTGGNMISEAAFSAQKESVKLLDKARAQARIFSLNGKIDGYLARLGSEIYDNVVLGATNVFVIANVKNILSRINECHVEIELIQKKTENGTVEEEVNETSKS